MPEGLWRSHWGWRVGLALGQLVGLGSGARAGVAGATGWAGCRRAVWRGRALGCGALGATTAGAIGTTVRRADRERAADPGRDGGRGGQHVVQDRPSPLCSMTIALVAEQQQRPLGGVLGVAGLARPGRDLVVQGRRGVAGTWLVWPCAASEVSAARLDCAETAVVFVPGSTRSGAVRDDADAAGRRPRRRRRRGRGEPREPAPVAPACGVAGHIRQGGEPCWSALSSKACSPALPRRGSRRPGRAGPPPRRRRPGTGRSRATAAGRDLTEQGVARPRRRVARAGSSRRSQARGRTSCGACGSLHRHPPLEPVDGCFAGLGELLPRMPDIRRGLSDSFPMTLSHLATAAVRRRPRRHGGAGPGPGPPLRPRRAPVVLGSRSAERGRRPRPSLPGRASPGAANADAARARRTS